MCYTEPNAMLKHVQRLVGMHIYATYTCMHTRITLCCITTREMSLPPSNQTLAATSNTESITLRGITSREMPRLAPATLHVCMHAIGHTIIAPKHCMNPIIMSCYILSCNIAGTWYHWDCVAWHDMTSQALCGSHATSNGRYFAYLT